MLKLDQETLETLRDERYHRSQPLHLRTEMDALAFINQVGFCFLFHDQHTEIPTLIEAISGMRRTVVNDHFDEDVGRAWEWKDSLPTAGLIYYGKQLRLKPTLISLNLLPCFYALSNNYGELDDYLEEYREGTLSQEAKVIYEVLLERGPLPTTYIRRYSHLWGRGETARRFERAIIELQVGFKIVKSGISDVSRWGYAYVYDLFLRRFPTVSEAARTINRQQAMEVILLQHLQNVVAASEISLQRLFRWDEVEWDHLCASLRARKLLCALAIENQQQELLTTTSFKNEYLAHI